MTDHNDTGSRVPKAIQDTHVGRAAKEVNAVLWLWRRYPAWLVILLLTTVIAFAWLVWRNRTLTAKTVELTAEKDRLQQRLAPFEAIAAKSFPNEQDRQRLDLLIRSIEELNKRYGSFELRRSDAVTLAEKVRAFASEFMKSKGRKPKLGLTLYAASSDASRRFFEQLRETLEEAGWELDVHSDLMIKRPERGLWIYTKNIEKPPTQFGFWIGLFADLGLNVRGAVWSGQLGDEDVAMLVNDPSYVR